MNKNHPWTQQEIDGYAKEYCASLRKRVRKHRCYGDPSSMKTDSWDIPRVAAACCSRRHPYLGERGRNTGDLRNPHLVLYQSYPSVVRRLYPHVHIPEYPGEQHFHEGHCAEPHAANRLLNEMDKWGVWIRISDMHFSKAFSVKNGMVKPYCATCKQTFPQLR